MKARTLLSGSLVLLACVWGACGKNAPGEREGAASRTPGDARSGQAGTSQTTTADAAQAVAEGAEVTLAGTLGCGHCNYHVATECAAALKTAAGDVYLIDNAGKDTELFQKRYDGIQVTVNGAVSQTDAGKHIAMKSYTIQ